MQIDGSSFEKNKRMFPDKQMHRSKRREMERVGDEEESITACGIFWRQAERRECK